MHEDLDDPAPLIASQIERREVRLDQLEGDAVALREPLGFAQPRRRLIDRGDLVTQAREEHRVAAFAFSKAQDRARRDAVRLGAEEVVRFGPVGIVLTRIALIPEGRHARESLAEG